VTSTFDPSWTPPVQTIPSDPEEQKKADEWLKYCWITPQDYDQGYDVYNQFNACQTLYWRYCAYNPSSPPPSPALTYAPTICTPDRAAYVTTTDPEPVDTPLPTQPNMIRGCVKFYLVESGNTCAAVARAQGVALTDFYKWNPSVGSDCHGLQLNAYVCVGYDSRLDFPVQTPAPQRRAWW